MPLFTTIKDGDRVALWDRAGRATIVEGPARALTAGRRVQPLHQHAAEADEYLVVTFRDGTRRHVHGPASVWDDPVRHESVDVQKAVALDANEAVVVYAHDGAAGDGAAETNDAGTVTRRVVRGPGLFVPRASEWLHEFRWHGADPRDPRVKRPRALTFTKLRVIPDQMYFDVDDARTADDALITVRLMVFFELADVETMLDRTHDPVGDFINALTADVIERVAGMTFERFKERTPEFNDLAGYPNLVANAARIGYRVAKVVYRGYGATAALQHMHDGAIESRTALKLEAETERQQQALADLKLAAEADRAEKRRALEKADAAHRRQLSADAHAEAQRRKSESRAAALHHAEAKGQQRTANLAALAGLGVDLTRYLVDRGNRPDRLIRVEHAGDDGPAPTRPQLHLHEANGR